MNLDDIFCEFQLKTFLNFLANIYPISRYFHRLTLILKALKKNLT